MFKWPLKKRYFDNLQSWNKIIFLIYWNIDSVSYIVILTKDGIYIINCCEWIKKVVIDKEYDVELHSTEYEEELQCEG